MGRTPIVDRSPEEKWQIVQESVKNGNVAERGRRHSIAPNLFYPHDRIDSKTRRKANDGQERGQLSAARNRRNAQREQSHCPNCNRGG
jgi:transposase-like protein